ncbi:MAG: hypothetical protein A2X28_04020 [Elusimicrobia bacterium GWA2_56_46]|nr:MAG: hypothetical protein A2X28_04020 [Elusimicrobia bacterium GWA2_56_46]OGR56224.1 MAG: hypothetical protein A2X39_07440 [Elusimicrobia bacterium GWC2_56_31]HBB67909.1 DNA-binding protein [Elusimicrobiota bacterium]HBW22876.1 DNA-binding protein [Elusimicrobiota bacterium]
MIKRELVLINDIERQIFLIRGHKVMVDRDLAALYQVPTKVLNQAVKRNRNRFPEGFMFLLTRQETDELVTNCDRFNSLKHSSTCPSAFTEYGVAMLSSVLRSERAIQINIQIIQTFIRLRQWALTHKELARKIAELENKSSIHDKHIQNIFEAIHELMNQSETPRRAIGFRP